MTAVICEVLMSTETTLHVRS